MSSGFKILLNLSTMTLMRLGTAGLSFLLLMFIARRLGPEFLGQFSTLLSFYMFVQQLPLLGLHLSVARSVAAKPELASRETTNALSLSAPVGVILAIGLGAVGHFLYPSSMHLAFWLVGLSCIPTSFTVVAESVLTGQEKIHLIGSILILENILRTGLCLAFLFNGYGLTYLFSAFLAGRLLAVAAYWWGAGFNRLFQVVEFGWKFVKTYLSRVHVFLGILVFSASFGRIDIILLSKLGNMVEAGYYSPAFKIYELGMMAPMIISMVLYPVFSRLFENSRTAYIELHYGLTRYLFGFGIPAVIILAALAGEVITLLFGTKYGASIAVLRLLSFALLLMALDQLLGLVLLSSHHENLDLKTLAFSFGLNVLLMVILIPFFGSLGAALAAFSTGVFRTCLRYRYISGKLKMPFRFDLAWSPFLAGGVMVSIIWALDGGNFMLSLLAGLCGYVIVWVGTKGITLKSLRAIRGNLSEG